MGGILKVLEVVAVCLFVGTCVYIVRGPTREATDPQVQEAFEGREDTVDDSLVDGAVSLAKFNAIMDRMSYYQVARIVGAKGTLVLSETVTSFGGRVRPATRSIYVWGDPGVKCINVTFHDDRLLSKEQVGLE